jgi:hypothetical protein
MAASDQHVRNFTQPLPGRSHPYRRDVPKRAWRWPNFSPAEIACRGTGKPFVNEPAIDKLQPLRDRLGSSFGSFLVANLILREFSTAIRCD